jgi:hypothetical protein
MTLPLEACCEPPPVVQDLWSGRNRLLPAAFVAVAVPFIPQAWSRHETALFAGAKAIVAAVFISPFRALTPALFSAGLLGALYAVCGPTPLEHQQSADPVMRIPAAVPYLVAVLVGAAILLKSAATENKAAG